MFIFILLFFGALCFLNLVVNPIIIETSSSKVKSLSQDAVNTAVFEVIKDASIYDSLVKIQRDEEGNITMISSNAVRINYLSREIIENAQKSFWERVSSKLPCAFCVNPNCCGCLPRKCSDSGSRRRVRHACAFPAQPLRRHVR